MLSAVDLEAPLAACLAECEPRAKAGQAVVLARAARAAPAVSLPRGPAPPVEPGRPARPALVHPGRVPRRRLGSREGHAALVHAIAHIEFNAINLALDAAYRFRGLPRDYYRDWLRVAGEEARHFTLLARHLASLGFAYGDFDAHGGLWQMAVDTAHDPLVRMALVPRVLEARGLDVTPAMTERLRAAGDRRGVQILGVIARDEVGHVAVGTRWFRYLCARRGHGAENMFTTLLARYLRARPKSPFATAARRRAGFTSAELQWLEARARES